MTFSQISLLSEDELDMVLFVINVIDPIRPPLEIQPYGLTWFKPGILEKKLTDAFPKVKPEFHSIYSSLLNKLGIQHEIKYEQLPSGSKI